jgi:hypothetical protein
MASAGGRLSKLSVAGPVGVCVACDSRGHEREREETKHDRSHDPADVPGPLDIRPLRNQWLLLPWLLLSDPQLYVWGLIWMRLLNLRWYMSFHRLSLPTAIAQTPIRARDGSPACAALAANRTAPGGSAPRMPGLVVIVAERGLCRGFRGAAGARPLAGRARGSAASRSLPVGALIVSLVSWPSAPGHPDRALASSCDVPRMRARPPISSAIGMTSPITMPTPLNPSGQLTASKRKSQKVSSPQAMPAAEN